MYVRSDYLAVAHSLRMRGVKLRGVGMTRYQFAMSADEGEVATIFVVVRKTQFICNL
jgi:hypothetical protein